MNVERKDERFWDGDYDAYGAGFNACIDEHVTRLQAEILEQRSATIAWRTHHDRVQSERDAFKAEVERLNGDISELQGVAWGHEGMAKHLQSELTKARKLLKNIADMQPDDWPGQGARDDELSKHWFAAYKRKTDLAENFLTHQSAQAEVQSDEHACQKCYGRGTLPKRKAGEGETEYRKRCQSAPAAKEGSDER